MKLSNFNDALLYSNKNIEKLASKLINESSNAALMEMFSDSCILADHETGNIYKSNFKFDGKSFVFENFEQIEFEADDSSLKEAISDYFDDTNVNLVESYESRVNESDAFESSLAEALSTKNMSNVIDYSPLEGINEDVEDLIKTDAFKTFSERVESHPLNNIKIFDWENPVKVSLIDEDFETVVSKSASQRAKKLRSDAEFKSNLVSAIREMNEGDNESMVNLLSENSCILSLNESDMKELVGMSVIGDKNLMENRKKICKDINSIIEEDDFLSDKRKAYSESVQEDDTSDAPELSEEDSAKFVEALKLAEERTSDEKLTGKIEEVIQNIEEAAANGETNVSAVKEAVVLLSM